MSELPPRRLDILNKSAGYREDFDVSRLGFNFQVSLIYRKSGGPASESSSAFEVMVILTAPDGSQVAYTQSAIEILVNKSDETVKRLDDEYRALGLTLEFWGHLSAKRFDEAAAFIK